MDAHRCRRRHGQGGAKSEEVLDPRLEGRIIRGGPWEKEKKTHFVDLMGRVTSTFTRIFGSPNNQIARGGFRFFSLVATDAALSLAFSCADLHQNGLTHNRRGQLCLPKGQQLPAPGLGRTSAAHNYGGLPNDGGAHRRCGGGAIDGGRVLLLLAKVLRQRRQRRVRV